MKSRLVQIIQMLENGCDPNFSALPHVGAVTVTLEQPSPKIIFSNNQAKLDCVITGQDRTIVDETQITWEIDGEVTSGVLGQVKSSSTQYSKTSTVTLDYTKWQNVNKVRCSATREDMTPVIQDLTVHRGGMLLSEGH